jgi:hypothetical protein
MYVPESKTLLEIFVAKAVVNPFTSEYRLKGPAFTPADVKEILSIIF